MKRMSVHEAKAHFSAVLKEVAEGETIIVTKHEKPVAEIRGCKQEHEPRPVGLFEGDLKLSDEAFAPLSEDDLRDWYGEA